MPFPPQLDSKVRTQFNNLIDEGPELVSKMKAENRQFRSEPRYLMGQPIVDLTGSEYHNQAVAFEAYRTQAVSLMQLVLSKTDRMQQISADFRGLEQRSSSVEFIIGTLIGLKRDYEAGLLDDISLMIEAEIASDYMGQAENLLGEGPRGSFDHVPAAVLTGAVLEDALRRLCQRQNPPIPLNQLATAKNPTGNPKTMGILIEDLKAAGVYTETKAKQLRAWSGIRNDAAHGDFSKFTRAEVELMISGVQVFLADYL